MSFYKHTCTLTIYTKNQDEMSKELFEIKELLDKNHATSLEYEFSQYEDNNGKTYEEDQFHTIPKE